MKILHLIDNFKTGGAQTVIKSIVENDPDNEHFLVKVRDVKEQTIKITIPEDHTICLGEDRSITPKKLQMMISFIRENNIDIVHVHLFGALFYGSLARKSLPNVKFVYHEHGGIMYMEGKPKGKTFFNRLAVKILSRSYDGVIAISKCIQEDLEDLNVKNITQIYNPLDLNRFKSANIDKEFLKKKIDILKNQKVVGFAGRFVKRKGWDIFLKLVNEFKDKEDVLFVMAGQGEDRELMYQYIENNDLQKRVFLVGALDDMPSYYSALDTLVVPSYKEPMGLVQIESMAMNTPVIATDVPAFNEMIFDKKNGLLFDPYHLDELYKKVDLLLNDKKMYDDLVKEGYKTAESFSVGNYLVSLNKFYNSIK